MRMFRFVLMLVGILVALGMAGLADAQVLGPLCSHLTAGLGGLSINVKIFATPTGGGQFLLTGVELGPPIIPLSGSAVVVGNTSIFQVTVAGTSQVPTLLISGQVDNTTGDGLGRCESNVPTPAGCTVEGIGLKLTGIGC